MTTADHVPRIPYARFGDVVVEAGEVDASSNAIGKFPFTCIECGGLLTWVPSSFATLRRRAHFKHNGADRIHRDEACALYLKPLNAEIERRFRWSCGQHWQEVLSPAPFGMSAVRSWLMMGLEELVREVDRLTGRNLEQAQYARVISRPIYISLVADGKVGGFDNKDSLAHAFGRTEIVGRRARLDRLHLLRQRICTFPKAAASLLFWNCAARLAFLNVATRTKKYARRRKLWSHAEQKWIPNPNSQMNSKWEDDPGALLLLSVAYGENDDDLKRDLAKCDMGHKVNAMSALIDSATSLLYGFPFLNATRGRIALLEGAEVAKKASFVGLLLAGRNGGRRIGLRSGTFSVQVVDQSAISLKLATPNGAFVFDELFSLDAEALALEILGSLVSLFQSTADEADVWFKYPDRLAIDDLHKEFLLEGKKALYKEVLRANRQSARE